jgi:hypothetical protein
MKDLRMNSDPPVISKIQGIKPVMATSINIIERLI